MCNNPSYERPVISFQFAFVSVLLSVLSQGSAPLQTQGLYLSRQVCFPSPSRLSRDQLVRLAHHADTWGIRMAPALLFRVLFGSLNLLIEEPDTSLGRWFHSPRMKDCGARWTLFICSSSLFGGSHAISRKLTGFGQSFT